ncbi:unnamed protein product [Rangifer tarandus platyrhynchus]|uniref:Uncharacterized protein n=2 Tax=Rangifer tarandus platyrhynchus TaxID=3082113 RepID=A0ACB0F5S7_RANTA|nr:unnamed protein product [Rangifer tarandus platyrhynchus]CAI9708281.1 unnamed protein product [Rangifer tarandus platyrhynchus]
MGFPPKGDVTVTTDIPKASVCWDLTFTAVIAFLSVCFPRLLSQSTTDSDTVYVAETTEMLALSILPSRSQSKVDLHPVFSPWARLCPKLLFMRA